MTEQVIPKTKYEDLTSFDDKTMWLTKYKQWERGLTDKDSSIRLLAYKRLGFTEEAKKDEYWFIRISAYEALGYTEEQFKDESATVRRAAYDHLGYTQEAMNDPNQNIQWRAAAYFVL